MEIAQDNPAPASPGQVLAESRERQGLSRAEVAQRLHMSPLQVEALEAGDSTRLPKGPFLRGFVRNYAKLLNVDAAPLVAGLTQAGSKLSAEIVVPSQNIRFEPLHERISSSPYVKGGLIAAVVLAFGAATFYWWTEIRSTPPAGAVAQKPVAPAAKQIAAPPLPAAETPPPTEAPQVDAPAATAPAAVKPAAVPPAQPPQAPRGTAKLSFTFRGDSWVEVKDATGETIMSRVNATGTQAQVSGKPPLTVIIGNAPSVAVRYNDRDFPLEPHTKVAVARFTVE